MPSPPSHLKIKSKWRPNAAGVWHLYMGRGDGGYVSACRAVRLRRVGGGRTCRPPTERRCGACDVHEIRVFLADASLEPSRDWRDADPVFAPPRPTRATSTPDDTTGG